MRAKKESHADNHTEKKRLTTNRNYIEKRITELCRKLYIIPFQWSTIKPKKFAHAPPTCQNAQCLSNWNLFAVQIKPMAKSVWITYIQCILKAFAYTLALSLSLFLYCICTFDYHFGMEFQIAGINSDCISLFHNMFTVHTQMCSLPEAKEFSG